MTKVFDDHVCMLGEGPLWHPKRNALFWFDILGKTLHCKGDGRTQWSFEEHVSAAAWVDAECLLLASATGLWRFDVTSGTRERIAGLEADDTTTRSNDGRADPQGGFWIGTMGLQAQAHAGAIYRFYRGNVRQMFDGVTIPNAICFAPDGGTAYFADTFSQQIQKVTLDADGWPAGVAEVFVDLRADGLNPDGAVVDAQGNLWNAQWGAGRVACYRPDGTLTCTVDIPASQATCPAFGGVDRTTLFVTSAADGSDDDKRGMTFCADLGVSGQQEHRVIL
ncbi:MAG: SMP-30/gluconolactonase/LRE family protein [Pseudomonadota bacterium]